MNLKEQKFDIISFSPYGKDYYPTQEVIDSFLEFSSEEEAKNMVLYTDIEIPLGHSRYGGPVIDIPKNQNFPIERSEFDHTVNNKDDSEKKYLRFVAQFDLSKFASLDKSGLLPKTGQLYAFADIYNSKCRVFYLPVANEDLERIVVKHEDNFFKGNLIHNFKSGTQTYNDYFRDAEEDDYECYDCCEDSRKCDCDDNSYISSLPKEYISEDGKIWNGFSDENESKFFGLFSHCQWSKEEIDEQMSSKEIVLFQVGENGFNDEGVFTVTIVEEDLKALNFDNCNCFWAQT